MRDLVIGDPHATADELDDVQRLVDLIVAVATSQPGSTLINRVIFLGDLHHNFSITNIRVIDFWRRAFKNIKLVVPKVIALVGNHDMPGDGSNFPHALQSYEDLVQVIDRPFLDEEKTLFLPYYANPNLFLEAVRQFSQAKRIICHQEFNGAMYENGFYSPNGVDPKAMEVPVISGHIHLEQELGKVWYPGAPRWRTVSDAKAQERFIWIVEGDKYRSGEPTGPYVKQIHHIVLDPEHSQLPVIGKEIDEYRVHISGPASLVKDQAELARKLYKHLRISTIVTDTHTTRVRESEGIEVAFGRYIESFQSKNGTPAAVLKDMARQRLL